jgi:hypothetical protein
MKNYRKQKEEKFKKEEREIEGVLWNLLFYVPLGKKKLRAQVYNKITDVMIVENVIKTQEDYDFVLSLFLSADEYVRLNNKSNFSFG